MNNVGWPAALRIGAILGVVGMLAPSLASAEIYAWIDSNGDVTYGNMPPPKNARVFEVIEEAPPASPQSQAAAQAAHEAEMRALNEKVQQLEQELRQSHMPPPAPYPMAGPPGYGPPPDYGPAPDYAAAPSYGPCDSDYYDCSAWAGPIYYSVGVAPYWGFRHRGFDHHGHFSHPGGGHFGGGSHFSGGGSHVGGVVAHASSHGGGGGGRSR